jgi:FAD/FMN-containing dehydrogenase
MGPEVMKGMYDTWHNAASGVKLVPGAVVSVAFQPIHKSINRISKEYGGLVLDLDDSVDRIILELDYSHWNAADDDTIDKATVKTYTDLRAKVQEYIKAQKLPDAHLPLFMNDAYFRQDYWGRLKSSNAQAHRETKRRFDPDGIFGKRTKGFMI